MLICSLYRSITLPTTHMASIELPMIPEKIYDSFCEHFVRSIVKEIFFLILNLRHKQQIEEDYLLR